MHTYRDYFTQVRAAIIEIDEKQGHNTDIDASLRDDSKSGTADPEVCLPRPPFKGKSW